MWKLKSPSWPLLTNLRETNSEITDVTKLTYSLGDFSVLNAQPNSTGSAVVEVSIVGSQSNLSKSE